MYKMLDLGAERFVEIQVDEDDPNAASVALLRGADAVCVHLDADQLDQLLAALTLARAGMRFFPPGTLPTSTPRKRR